MCLIFLIFRVLRCVFPNELLFMEADVPPFR